MNLGRIVGFVVTLVLLLAAAAFFFFRYTLTSGRLQKAQAAIGMEVAPPEKHIVPEGFRGWMKVDYGVEGAAPLGLEGEVVVLEYPGSGNLETSTPAPEADGMLHKQYFESRGGELVPLTRLSQVWGEYSMRSIEDDGSNRRSSGFFIGTMGEFREAERPLPALGPLKR